MNNTELDLNCTKCSVAYKKPLEWAKWVDNIFYKMSLSYCDKCRKDRELAALEALPKVLNALANGTIQTN